ncbi:hypothetical protein [Streptomyces sp. NPDC002537]
MRTEPLEALRPVGRPPRWTSEPLEPVTVPPLPAELDARRPASVLDHQEERPEGRFALL